MGAVVTPQDMVLAPAADTGYATRSTNAYDMTDRCIQANRSWSHAYNGWDWHAGACWQHGFGKKHDPEKAKSSGDDHGSSYTLSAAWRTVCELCGWWYVRFCHTHGSWLQPSLCCPFLKTISNKQATTTICHHSRVQIHISASSPYLC